MDYFKKIERSVTISADKRLTVDLQVDVWSQDLNVTKFILKLDTTDSAAIDLTNATVRVAMVYNQGGQDVKIEAAGIVEDVATQKIAYVMGDRLAGFEGQVTAGFYVTLSTGQRIDIQNVTFNMRKSLLDKDLDVPTEDYYQTFDDIVADVQSEGEKSKTDINAVVSDVNGYADSQKQVINNIVSDVQSTGDTAKADIKATLPSVQAQVSELKEDLEDYGIGQNALPDRSGTYTDNGITYIIQDDKHTISVNGTATAGSFFSWSQVGIPAWIATNKKYIAKVINGDEKIGFVIYAYVNGSWQLLASTNSTEKEFTIPENTVDLWIRLEVAKGDTVSALITPVIADTYTLYKQQEDIAKQQEDIAKQKKDLEYLVQTNSSFNFIKFKMGFIDYYGVESASNTRAVSDYIPGNAIFKIYNPLNVPVTWHFYDASKKHLGVTKSDYPTKEIRYLDMTDYAYFRLVTKENDNPTKSNTISYKKINPADEVKQIQNVSSVAHQGYSVTERFYGDSRLSSYKGAKDAGFSDAETDIVWTSDGIPVCCHDKTFVDATTRETITISEHTLSELKKYNYYGEKICSFEEIINECKKLGLVLHIDHANEFIEESQFTTLLNIVKKYQMQNYVWWASAHENHIRMMLNIFPYANIARAVDKTWLDSNLVALEKIHNDFPNAKLCIEQNYTEFSTDYTLESLIAKIPSYIGLCIWNVDDIDLYAKYFPYVSAMSSNKISYPMYAMRKIYCEKN